MVFRCVRIVVFGTWFGCEESLVLTHRNFPPFFLFRARLCDEQCLRSPTALITLNASQGTGAGATSISAMEGRAHRHRAKAPFSHRSWDKGWAFSASAEGNARRGPSGRKPHAGGGASEGKRRPEAILLAGVRASPLPQLREGRGAVPRRGDVIEAKIAGASGRAAGKVN